MIHLTYFIMYTFLDYPKTICIIEGVFTRGGKSVIKGIEINWSKTKNL